MLSFFSLSQSNLDSDTEAGDRTDDAAFQDPDGDDAIRHSSAMTKAQIRKSNKPIMEKRRRARINTCLNELKSLILDALKKDPSRHSKLEKADILEMTVKHLQAVQRRHLALAAARDPSVLQKFKGGFADCAQEITRYISRLDGVDVGVRQRLLQHLSNCTGSLNTATPISFAAMAGLPPPFASPPFGNHQHPPPPNSDLNNNQARVLHRLVAARLAAAGDTAGAALLLQGGLSLLARSAPPPTHPSPANAPPPPLRTTQPTLPREQPKLPIQTINVGASSSASPIPRLSAFTAVKRSLSPTKVPQSLLPPSQKVIAPKVIRPISCDARPRTVIQAQVALKPILPNDDDSAVPIDDSPVPIDFSCRKDCRKRPAEVLLCPRPAKVLKLKEGGQQEEKDTKDLKQEQDGRWSWETQNKELNVPSTSSPQVTIPTPLKTATSSPASNIVEPAPDSSKGEPAPESVRGEPAHNDQELPEGDERDMWRPW